MALIENISGGANAASATVTATDVFTSMIERFIPPVQLEGKCLSDEVAKFIVTR